MDVPDDDFGIDLQGVAVLGMTGRVILPLLPDLTCPTVREPTCRGSIRSPKNNVSEMGPVG